MLYLRDITNRISDLSKQFPAIILTGARQTGKTTLLKEIFPQHTYVTLDLPSDAEMAENDPELFLSQHSTPLIIDEAQYAPKLFRHLKYAIDLDRDNVGQYILTGSQKFNLMKEVSDSLAGRCAWLELEGLSISEIQVKEKFTLSLNEISQFITRGFLPELWKKQNINHTEYYRSYLATYLERDVRQILNISSLRDFERFIRVCASRNAQLLNKSEIAKDVGITVNTVNQWIGVLEASNQITLLEPYFANVGKRVIKSPKIYFNEIGLLAYLLNINKENLQDSPFVGEMWETLIFNEFNKYIKNISPESKLWFYRDNRSQEIDFIFEHSNRLDFYEVKWTQNPASRAIDNLFSIHQQFLNANLKHLSIGDCYIICRTPSAFIKKGITITPFEKFIKSKEMKK